MRPSISVQKGQDGAVRLQDGLRLQLAAVVSRPRSKLRFDTPAPAIHPTHRGAARPETPANARMAAPCRRSTPGSSARRLPLRAPDGSAHRQPRLSAVAAPVLAHPQEEPSPPVSRCPSWSPPGGSQRASLLTRALSRRRQPVTLKLAYAHLVPDLVSVDEAAREFRRSRKTIFTWLREDRLTSCRSEGDRRTLVDRAEIRRLIEPRPEAGKS